MPRSDNSKSFIVIVIRSTCAYLLNLYLTYKDYSSKESETSSMLPYVRNLFWGFMNLNYIIIFDIYNFYIVCVHCICAQTEIYFSYS